MVTGRSYSRRQPRLLRHTCYNTTIWRHQTFECQIVDAVQLCCEPWPHDYDREGILDIVLKKKNVVSANAFIIWHVYDFYGRILRW